jgi:hypothetical protein
MCRYFRLLYSACIVCDKHELWFSECAAFTRVQKWQQKPLAPEGIRLYLCNKHFCYPRNLVLREKQGTRTQAYHHAQLTVLDYSGEQRADRIIFQIHVNPSIMSLRRIWVEEIRFHYFY